MGWQDKHKVVPAAYVILRDNNKVLLLRRANTGYMDGSYSLPSGHIDGGEPADAAAVREAKEEIDVVISLPHLHLVHVIHKQAEEGDHERVCFFFEASEWQGEPRNAEPDKCDDLRWFNLNNLPDKMAPEVSHALTQIEQGHIYSSQNF